MDTIDYALLYLDKGLSIIPLLYKDKKPLINWKKYQINRPSKETVTEWFKKKKNIGIVTGTISKNLVVLDFDDKEAFKKWSRKLPENIKNILDWTWIVETGKGFHVYFRLKYPSLVPRTKPKLTENLDVKAEGGYIVAPPSIHPSGKRYSFLQNPQTTNIYILSEEEWNIIKKTLGWVEEDKTEASDQHDLKELSETNILKIVDALRDAYRKGYRDLIILYLTGWLKKNNVSYSTAKMIVELLAENDEERKSRLYVVDRTYGKKGNMPKEIKGRSGLQEILENVLGEEKALDVIKTLEDIIGPSPYYDSLFSLIDLSKKLYWVNNPRRGWIALASITKDGRVVYGRIALRAAIEKLRIIRSPVGGPSIYEIDWITESGRKFSTRGLLYDHLGRLKLEALIASKRLVEDAIQSIIQGMERRGKSEIVEELEVEGFYLNSNVLHSKSRREICEEELDEKIDKLETSLLILDELVNKWFKNSQDKAVTILKWHIIAPFNFARKQLGVNPLPMLLIIGPGATGKTTLAGLSKYIWGLSTTQFETTGQSIGTPARLGYKLSLWTYPLVVNEPAEIFDRVELREMIKNAWDSLIARGKYHHGEYVEVPSLAPIIFVTNEPLDSRLSEAELRRMFIVRFSWNDRIPREKQREFNEWKKVLNILSIVGDFVYQIIKNDLEILKKEWLEASETVLEKLFRLAGLDKPSWISLRIESQDIDPVTEWKELIKDAIKEYVADVIVRYSRREELASRPSLEDRLIFISENRLPSNILYDYDRGEVLITKGFLDFLRDKGIRLSSLRDLAEMMSWNYGPKMNRRLGINSRSVAFFQIKDF